LFKKKKTLMEFIYCEVFSNNKVIYKAELIIIIIICKLHFCLWQIYKKKERKKINNLILTAIMHFKFDIREAQT